MRRGPEHACWDPSWVSGLDEPAQRQVGGGRKNMDEANTASSNDFMKELLNVRARTAPTKHAHGPATEWRPMARHAQKQKSKQASKQAGPSSINQGSFWSAGCRRRKGLFFGERSVFMRETRLGTTDGSVTSYAPRVIAIRSCWRGVPQRGCIAR